MTERLQKLLARAGVGSRRKAEEWIKQGRIQVNGKTAVPGLQVSGGERILLDGKPVRIDVARLSCTEVLMYHKPVGEVCSRKDPQGRQTVFQALPKPKHGRWVGVGRLDINTSGLMLFTTDGQLAHRLMHPSQEIEREYAVRILGEVNMDMLKRLVQGVNLDDGVARFDVVEESGGSGANRWFHVIIKEGRNREVRRLWESQGVVVSRLARIRFGPLVLSRNLRRGSVRALSRQEKQQLYQAAGLKMPKD